MPSSVLRRDIDFEYSEVTGGEAAASSRPSFGGEVTLSGSEFWEDSFALDELMGEELANTGPACEAGGGTSAASARKAVGSVGTAGVTNQSS